MSVAVIGGSQREQQAVQAVMPVVNTVSTSKVTLTVLASRELTWDSEYQLLLRHPGLPWKFRYVQSTLSASQLTNAQESELMELV